MTDIIPILIVFFKVFIVVWISILFIIYTFFLSRGIKNIYKKLIEKKNI